MFLFCNTSTTLGSRAYLCSLGSTRHMIVTRKTLTIEWQIAQFSSITAQTIHIQFTRDIVMPPRDIVHHIGWKIVNADLFAVNSDGTQKITDTLVDITIGNQRTRLKIVFIPGTDVKFYVNGVLKVIHTTNLPTLDDLKLNMGITTNEGVKKFIMLNRVLIEKEY